ncbi:hypothetical protein [Paenisporosarcina cavernae]|uniref:Uncharacterized protein n=1 Tax=Paenisporosarcina cavernae TaxID=2320858 RepID=A0A385YRZ2_9BACL|nr:hypothetical protein [Paenisporosarcina cavernae]AYC29264.1 hypothetical protein D3873_04980 [Paenisporosarcina cavernae]
MSGTLLTNFWAALLGFTLYFLSSFPFTSPVKTLVASFTWAFIFFLLAFVVRFVIHYVMEPKTPEALEEVEGEQLLKELIQPNAEDATSEQVAQVVKTMLDENHQEAQ